MSVSLTFPFNNAGDYTFNTSLIQVSGGKASLKLCNCPETLFTQEFDSDTGFIYDSAKAEFTGGKVQQKDQRPAGATLGATYTSSINGNWGDGVLTGTAFNGAAIVGNKLDCTGTKYVRYAAAGNVDFTNVGAIKFKITPAYNGKPGATITFFAITMELIENENMNNSAKYKFVINNKSYYKTVPNESTKHFWLLN